MAIAVDLDPAWTTNTGTSSTQSATFSPQAGSLILVTAVADSGTSSITCTITNSAGLTVNHIGSIQIGTSGGACHAAWMYTSGAQTNMTVTATWSGTGTTGGKGVKPTTFTGTTDTSAVTSRAAANSTTNNLTANYTNGTDGSRGMGVGCDWNQLGTPTSTDTETGLNIAGAISGISVYKAANTSGTSQTVNINMDAGGSGAAAWSYKLFEILPAAGGSDATATPAVLATTTALTRPNVNIVAGPAVLATAEALARPNVNVVAGPAVLATVTALNRPDVNIAASPTVLAAPYALPQATPSVGGDGTATPAVIATVTSLSTVAVNVTVGATVIPTTVALARPDINTSAGPAALAAVTALPQVAINVTVGTTVIPTVVSIPTPGAGGSTTAAPAAIAAVVTLPRPSINVSAGPTTVALVVTIPQVTLPGSTANATSDPTVAAAVASVAAVSALRTSSPTLATIASSTSAVSDG